MDVEDADGLTGVDEVNEETFGGEENASRGGNATNALTVDVARMVAEHIFGQPEESIPCEARLPGWRPDRARLEVVTWSYWSYSHSELVASPVLERRRKVVGNSQLMACAQGKRLQKEHCSMKASSEHLVGPASGVHQNLHQMDWCFHSPVRHVLGQIGLDLFYEGQNSAVMCEAMRSWEQMKA